MKPLPSEIASLHPQLLPDPCFATLKWSDGRTGKLVACIPAKQVDAFVVSECERVHLKQLNAEPAELSGIGDKALNRMMLSNTLYRCPYSKERSSKGKARAELGARAVKDLKGAGENVRISKRDEGLSIKSCMCAYKLRVAVYEGAANAYLYLFNQGNHSKEGASEPAHGPGSQAHASFRGAPRISQECAAWVKACLRDKLSPQTIIAGAPLTTGCCHSQVRCASVIVPRAAHRSLSCPSCLSSLRQTPPPCAANRERLQRKHAAAGNVVEIIQDSPDARDYCLDTRDIANLRQHVAFETFMRHKQDGASVQQLVRRPKSMLRVPSASIITLSLSAQR
jgi:hypothetical protein